MASLKGSSGLTRDRFLSDFSRVVWVLSRTGVLTIDMKLKEMTDTNFQSSEQHIIIKQDHPSKAPPTTGSVKIPPDPAFVCGTICRILSDFRNIAGYCRI